MATGDPFAEGAQSAKPSSAEQAMIGGGEFTTVDVGNIEPPFIFSALVNTNSRNPPIGHIQQREDHAECALYAAAMCLVGIGRSDVTISDLLTIAKDISNRTGVSIIGGMSMVFLPQFIGGVGKVNVTLHRFKEDKLGEGKITVKIIEALNKKEGVLVGLDNFFRFYHVQNNIDQDSKHMIYVSGYEVNSGGFVTFFIHDPNLSRGPIRVGAYHLETNMSGPMFLAVKRRE